MLSRLFIADVWSPAGKGLTSRFLFVMFNCVLPLSHVVSWVRCGTLLYRFLIFATFLTFICVYVAMLCPVRISTIGMQNLMTVASLSRVPSAALHQM